FQAEDGIRDRNVTGVQTCALPIFSLAKKHGDAGALVLPQYSAFELDRAGDGARRGPGPRPVAPGLGFRDARDSGRRAPGNFQIRSEEHTSELQSRFDLVCRLLLEK